MVTFPLLQLPLVAMENVLCMMSPFELGDGMSWTYLMTKNGNGLPRRYIHRVDDFYTNEQIIMFTKKPLKDLKNWFEYVKEVLNCKIDSVTLDLDCPSSENRQAIDWIASQNKTLDYAEIKNNRRESDDDLRYFMERLHVTGVFNLMVKKYKADFRIEIPVKPERLHIGNSRFVNYDLLLRLKSPDIVLRKSILTNEEINRFLKSWMSYEIHLELEAIRINGSGPDAMNEIMNLPHEKTNDPEIVEAFKGDPHHIQVENKIFTIKRCDGKKKASVTVAGFLNDWRFCLIVH
uniref:FBA_2 domain-containing protein n=1 Tax=Caenorhabditis tropicalis TaxID=1561998 RepID=A0A1I7UU20_9PELO